MMYDLFDKKMIDRVIDEYLKLESSIRRFYDEHMDCSWCGPENGCCCYEQNFPMTPEYLFSSWDQQVIDHTYPEHDLVDEENYDGRCVFLGENGCIIPKGRPNKCTTFLCEQNEDILSGNQFVYILGSYKMIESLMTSLFKEQRDIDYEINTLVKINSYFEIAKQSIDEDDRFTKKFDHESIA